MVSDRLERGLRGGFVDLRVRRVPVVVVHPRIEASELVRRVRVRQSRHVPDFFTRLVYLSFLTALCD